MFGEDVVEGVSLSTEECPEKGVVDKF